MDDTQKRIRLYRSLIGVGIVLAIVSLFLALTTGANPVMAFWVPVAYAFVAWVVYRVVVDIWARTHRDGNP